MKKYLFVIPVFFLAMGAAYTQSADNNLVPQLDNAVKELAASIHAKLIETNAGPIAPGQIALGQYTYQGSLSRFATYWVNQLTSELTNIPDRPYTILSGGLAGATQTISGEIVDVAGTIRVYTRLIYAENRAVAATFQSDFERSQALAAMLASSDDSRSDRSSSSSSSSVPMDEWEPDSWEYPLSYEPGTDENAQLINRTIHGNGDEDFFQIIAQTNGRLVLETTGDTDTYMEFYDADTRELLAENDDGGSGSNARIRYTVQAGKQYIAKVRGYGRSTTGHYAFRAYLFEGARGGTWENPIRYEPGIDENTPVINCFLSDYERGHFLIIPETDGRLTIETTGSLDTLMKLHDADTRTILAEDDDSGQSLNARIHYNVQAGKSYIVVVSEYDDESGDYGFRAYFSRR